MLKLKISILSFTFISLSIFGLQTVAQTPDGQTPAEETVCDPLKADGVSKGLYGLCVAFCEAQDRADFDEPMTESELEALLESVPSGSILASYNKKKDRANNPNDPDMPCVKVEEPCPCWDSAEFDGVTLSSNPEYRCERYNRPNRLGSFFQSWDPGHSPSLKAVQANATSTGGASCAIYDAAQSPLLYRRIPTTVDQFAACDAQIRQAMIDTSRSCTDYN